MQASAVAGRQGGGGRKEREAECGAWRRRSSKAHGGSGRPHDISGGGKRLGAHRRGRPSGPADRAPLPSPEAKVVIQRSPMRNAYPPSAFHCLPPSLPPPSIARSLPPFTRAAESPAPLCFARQKKGLRTPGQKRDRSGTTTTRTPTRLMTQKCVLPVLLPLTQTSMLLCLPQAACFSPRIRQRSSHPSPTFSPKNTGCLLPSISIPLSFSPPSQLPPHPNFPQTRTRHSAGWTRGCDSCCRRPRG